MENIAQIVSEGSYYEVHVQLSDELIGNIDQLKSLLNEFLSGSYIHACMFRYGTIIKFKSSGFGGWSEQTAQVVLKKASACLPVYVHDTTLQKRKRQVRDALNKCTDLDTIEKIGNILKV